MKKEVVDSINIVVKEMDEKDVVSLKKSSLKNSLSKIQEKKTIKPDLNEDKAMNKQNSFFSMFQNNKDVEKEDSETIKVLKKYLDD